MDDKILVILMVTLLCVATLGVAMHSPAEALPDNVISLIEKALYGLFGLAGGAGVGFALGKKVPAPKSE